MNVTVYVDDISLSADSEQELRGAMLQLDEAAQVSGFSFNSAKTQMPGRLARSFNIEFGSGQMKVLPDQLAEFEVALRKASGPEAEGILGYVASVSDESLEELEDLLQ